MARDKITEYDSTANNNTVCGDVNIAENSALPSDMNNFAREIMSHLKEGLGSGTPLYVDQTNNRLGINTSSPATALDVTGTVTAGGLTVSGTGVVGTLTSSNNNTVLRVKGNGATTGGAIGSTSSDDLVLLSGVTERMRISSGGDISFYEDTGTTPKLFWDASAEALGIGTTSPTLGSTGYGLHIKGGTNKDGTLKLDSTTANYSGVIQFTENGTDQWRIAYDGTNNHLEFTESGVADRMVIQDGGNVGIGTSSPASDYRASIKGDYSAIIGGIEFDSGGGDKFTIGHASATSPSGKLNVEGAGNLIMSTNNIERIRIDANGHVTMQYQSAFSAKITSQQSNIALSSQVTVLFATELYDQNSDYNTSTYTFTAPVTGKYQLDVLILVVNIDTVPGYYQTQLTTSNRTYYNTHDPRGYSQDLTYHNLNTSVLADMDAGDTAIVKIYQAGGTQQTDLDAESYFTGHLVC